MFRKFLFAALAAAAALLARPSTSAAQQALVYCPTGADAGGCARISQAIAGKFARVDRAYDGTNGTLDLREVDLDHYAVIVVPSLADAGDRTPYELLRGQAARMQLAVTGRVAVFSGAPDQGAANREAKDAIIANLVRWAAEGHTRPVGLVGLVAFQDLSENAAARYDWVAKASPVEVSADEELRSFRSVRMQAPTRASFFRDGDKELAYPNMASYGLHIGARAAARTVSAAVGGDEGQSVLVTYGEPGSVGPMLMAAVAGGDTAWIDTDKPDYQPGDVVTFTGGNWAPGDTVKITIHEDPHWVLEHQDRFVVAVAGQDGTFSNRDFVVHANDFGVTFTTTAVAAQSGKTAQHIFTDAGIQFQLATADNALMSSSAPAVTWTASYRIFSGSSQNPNNACSGGGTAGTISYANNTGSAVNVNANGSLQAESAQASGYAFLYWSESATSTTPVSGAALCAAGAAGGASTIAKTYYAHFKKQVSVTINSVAATASVYGGTTNLSANVAPATVGSVAFYVNGSSTAIPAAYDASTGAATVNGYSHGLNASATAYGVRAVFTPSAGSAVEATNSSALLVGIAGQTITFASLDNKTYGDPDFNVSATASSGLAVSFAGSGNCAVTGTSVHITGAGSCTVTAMQAGDANHNAAPDASQAFTIAKAGQTITFAQPATPAIYNTKFTVTPTASSTLPVSVIASGACTINAETGEVTMTSGTGTCTLTATQAGNDNYEAAPNVVASVAAQKASQTLTFAQPATPAVFNTTFTVAPMASSTLPVNVAASGVCSISSGSVTMTSGTGNCTLAASQAGDNNYNAAPSVERTVAAAKASQTITALGAPATAIYHTTFAITKAATSGLPVTVTPSGVCSINDATVTMESGTGTCTLTATQAGNDNYNAAPNVVASVTAEKAEQAALTLLVPSSITYGTTGMANYTGGSGTGEETYSAGASTGCAVNASGVISVSNASGSCSISVTKETDANYKEKIDGPKTVTLIKASAAVTLSNLVWPISGPGKPTATTSPSGSAVNFTYNGSATLPSAVGVYELVATISSDNYVGSTSALYVLYDPTGGFVTGGGWIDSPAGAYAADPTLTGKANFGFVAKYQKGQTVPTGNTEFQFKAGNLNLKSTSYDWLVISGSKAQFKGVGTVNGSGSYEFTLTVIDGDTNGAKKPDTFRIRILDKSKNNVVMYDNLLNAPDQDDPTTILGGGSIQIQSK